MGQRDLDSFVYYFSPDLDGLFQLNVKRVADELGLDHSRIGIHYAEQGGLTAAFVDLPKSKKSLFHTEMKRREDLVLLGRPPIKNSLKCDFV